MPAQRILIIKHGALGDVVLAMGTMKRLRELHPEAHITLMTMGMFVPMAEQLGVFDDFIVDNRLPYWKLGATWRAVRSIVKGNFDVVYDLQESSRTRKRYYPAVRFLLNHDMDWVACNSGERRKLLKKKSFRWGKVEREPFRLERVLTDLSFMHGEGLHFDELPERYVMMIPGCSPNHPYKRWPVENFCALAKRLAARGVSSVVIGTRAEAAEVEAIAASSPLAVSFLGKSSLMDIPQMALRSLACVGPVSLPKFHSPEDKIVFDVSHQSYVHKMLTGRKDAFLHAEQYDEVSGYSEPMESVHDHFVMGHTSTSVSLAGGLVKGRDLTGKGGNVIAVIGDGSLSGGEALPHERSG